MDIYIYLALVISLIFACYETVTVSIKYCPIKIKEVIILIFTLVIFRAISLWILLLLDNIKLVYIVRNLVFLNVIYMPMIMFLCIYIFYRNKALNLKWIYYIFFIGVILYLACLFLMPMEYYISTAYGYNIVLGNMVPYKALLCFGGLAFFIGMKGLMYKYSVKWGMTLIEISALVFIITSALVLKSTENIGLLLVGELAWILTVYGGVRTFLKKS